MRTCFAIAAAFSLAVLSGIHADAAEDKSARRKATIAYGTEAEISDLVKALVSEKDQSLNADLAAVAAKTGNPRLLEALFRYFGDTKWPGAEATAAEIVGTRDGRTEAVVTSCFYYLAQAKSPLALPAAREILSTDEKDYLAQAVKYMGAAGEASDEEALLAKLARDVPEPLRLEILLALGGIGTARSVETLIGILDNRDSPKTARLYSADALGNLADPRGLATLLKAAVDSDASLRQYAVTALGNFPGIESGKAVLEALRDTNARVRIEAAKSTARIKPEGARAFLEYKARYDGERKVREAAFTAIAETGGSESFSFLAAFLGDAKNGQPLRQLCWSLLLKHDPDSSLPAISAALEEAAASKDESFLNHMVREVAAYDGLGARKVAERMSGFKQIAARSAAVEYARRNKAGDMIGIVEKIAAGDPAESLRKKAAETLEALRQ